MQNYKIFSNHKLFQVKKNANDQKKAFIWRRMQKENIVFAFYDLSQLSHCPIRSKKVKKHKDNKMMTFGVDKLRHTIRRIVSM